MASSSQSSTESEQATDFVLGYEKTEDCAVGKPRVLSLLSSAISKSVKTNEQELKASRRDEMMTSFQRDLSDIGIQSYIEHIFKFANCTPSCFVRGCIYMDRFLQEKGIRLTSYNVHRLLITSIMVASKLREDESSDIKHFALVGAIPEEELKLMELDFLTTLKFNLHVADEIFNNYCKQLKEEAPGEATNEPPTLSQTNPLKLNLNLHEPPTQNPLKRKFSQQ
ncbi:Cyclin PHO80-like [Dillenia turbinata]|uniref:Cyclin PHO80-like n=1 Tax=Dillenia turbinata TaxID=194707 RepID=A0AAN8U9Z6_9MAGN